MNIETAKKAILEMIDTSWETFTRQEIVDDTGIPGPVAIIALDELQGESLIERESFVDQDTDEIGYVFFTAYHRVGSIRTSAKHEKMEAWMTEYEKRKAARGGVDVER